MGIVRKRKVVLYARVSSNTQKDEVSKVVVAYPDRLVRFGFEIIEEVCKAHNCELVVLNKEDKTPEQKLIEDLISILVSFSGKLYGMRSHKYEKVKKCVEELKA